MRAPGWIFPPSPIGVWLINDVHLWVSVKHYTAAGEERSAEMALPINNRAAVVVYGQRHFLCVCVRVTYIAVRLLLCVCVCVCVFSWDVCVWMCVRFVSCVCVIYFFVFFVFVCVWLSVCGMLLIVSMCAMRYVFVCV